MLFRFDASKLRSSQLSVYFGVVDDVARLAESFIAPHSTTPGLL
jgi:hypothetical protein